MSPLLPLLFFLLSPLTLSSPNPNPNLPLWPYPTTLSWPSSSIAPLSPSFHILSPPHRHLRIAIRRYKSLISIAHHPLSPILANLSPTSKPITLLSINITNPKSPLHHGVDESYTLYIPSSGGYINLNSNTPWGAMRGLETLSQMVWRKGSTSIIPVGVYIADKPLFPHRGVLLDTARNYYPVKDLLRTIRAMGYNKMNVFHWHVTDSQSFPIELPSEARLAVEGAYGEGMRYTVEDVKRVVDYAMSFGVRVIPEIDAPGHTASWAGAYPDLVTCAGMFWAPADSPSLAAEPGPGQLNPLLPNTYQVLRNVYTDITSLFPEPFLHVGVDEVSPACWEQDAAIRTFISNNGTLDQVLETFVNNTHPIIVHLNRTAIYWEDVILSSTIKVRPSLLPTESTIMQTWNNGPNNTKQLTAAGYRVIVSSADFYYLDCGHGGWVGNDSRYDRQDSDIPGQPFNYAGGNGGSWCAPFKTWQRVYDYDITYGLTDQEAKLVLGGEVALWSEQSDETVVDGRLWPRAAAAAEAWWSGNRDKDGKKRYAEATARIDEWRHRMVGRKIGAEPIQPLWCSKNPGMCNLYQ